MHSELAVEGLPPSDELLEAMGAVIGSATTPGGTSARAAGPARALQGTQAKIRSPAAFMAGIQATVTPGGIAPTDGSATGESSVLRGDKAPE